MDIPKIYPLLTIIVRHISKFLNPESVSLLATNWPKSKHLIGFRRDRREAVFLFALIMLQCMSPLLALSGQFSRARVCPLSDNSDQISIFVRDDLSAFDPKRT
jgi:hypothetical protein